jgi:hypothetical protein
MAANFPADVPAPVADLLPYFQQDGLTSSGARVPLAHQGPGARADHRRSRLRHPFEPADAAALYDEDVTRQAQQLGLNRLNNAHLSSAPDRRADPVPSRDGGHEFEQSTGMTGRCRHRCARNATPPGKAAAERLPDLVLPAGRGRLSACSSRLPTIASLYLQPDAVDPVRLAPSSASPTSSQFFSEPFLVQGLVNTLIYAVVTSGLKVVLGMMLALLLTSHIIGRGYLRAVVFFPDPRFDGRCRHRLRRHDASDPGRHQRERSPSSASMAPAWLTNPRFALYLGRARRRLEGRRPRHGHLHGRRRRDPAGLFRSGAYRRRQIVADRFRYHHRCRSAVQRPSP